MSDHATLDDLSGAGPLAGVRVLDIGTMLAAPIVAQILGDFGADVIKVEHPAIGDTLRHNGRAKDGVPLWWKSVGRNKHTITLDLSKPEGAELFRKLAITTDVIVENFRPGTMEKWGLSYESLNEANPDLILLRISGFGQQGPYVDRPAYGTVVECLGGWAHMNGQPDGPPTLPPYGLADNLAAMSGAIAVCMALFARQIGMSRGQLLDVSLMRSIMAPLSSLPLFFDQLGVIESRTGNGGAAPRGIFRTLDGSWVGISAASEQTARRVAIMIERPDFVDQEWYATGRSRQGHEEEINAAVAAWIGARDLAKVVESAALFAIPLGTVQDIGAVMQDPQVNELDIITTVHDEQLGKIRMNNVLFGMSETPGRVRFPGRQMGADNSWIFAKELGLSDADIARLAKEMVI
jgi:crotonobetainyl-CoA:carnitine CoA-transferase CaiB-like acyl-CoA transferase